MFNDIKLKSCPALVLAGAFQAFGLSLTYIPLGRIVYSLLTVVLSGQIIGWIQRVKLPKKGH